VVADSPVEAEEEAAVEGGKTGIFPVFKQNSPLSQSGSIMTG
jgi:hypothetical protein